MLSLLCDIATGGDADDCDDDCDGGEGGVSTVMEFDDDLPSPSLGIISNPLP